MDSERWRRIKEVFEGALSLGAPERAGYLTSACAGDDGLRAEVESILASYERDPEFIEKPAFRLSPDETPTAAGPPPPPGAAAGRRLGAYRLIAPLGAGGMGSVYLGFRDDDEYQRRVAVKLVAEGDGLTPVDPARRADLLRRFRTERQTLANLDHPGIPKLLDGGTTDDGLCYLVMEYVEGWPIDRYCDERALSIAERLRLFRAVCAAVHYAHTNLVVHRDLKPSNILVTDEDVPKLLDFGIAKLLEPGGAGDPDATQTGWQIMTPAYASPEQVAGRPITTASDVYSLGIILFELLTGRRPYRLTGLSSRRDIAQIVCEQEPPRPSSVVTSSGPEADPAATDSLSRTRGGSPDRLRRRLAGDLDTIVLKALRKDPQRRYASVEQFAEDIRRHRRGLPVLARPDTLSYRATKFIARHKSGVATAATLVLALVGGIAATSALARAATTARNDEREQRTSAVAALGRAEQAERRAAADAEAARRSEAEAAGALQFLVELFGVPDPFSGSTLTDARGTSITAGEILRTGAKRVELDLADQPALQARVMDAIGRVYQRLGAIDDAEPLMTGALETRKRLFGDDNTEVATSLNSVANLRLERGDYAGAEPMLTAALDIRRRHLAPDTPAIAATLSNLAHLAQRTSDHARAADLYREALAIYERASTPGSGPDSEFAAITLGNLASALHEAGDHAQAEAMQRRCLETLRRVHAGAGGDHPDVAQAAGNLGAMLLLRFEFTEAEALLREALDVERRVLEGDHPILAQTLHNLAAVYDSRGQFEESLALYDEALAMRRRILGDDHPDVAQTLNNVGYIRYVQGRYEEAEATFRQALDIRLKRLTAPHRDLALSLHNLASALMLQNRLDEAAPLFAQALAMRRVLFPGAHPDTAETLANLGALALRRHDYPGSIQLLREALQIRRDTLGADAVPTADSMGALGAALRDAGELGEAEALLREAVAIHRTLPPGNHRLGGTLTGLGSLLVKAGRAAEAEPILREAHSMRRKAQPNHWTTANTASVLGECLGAQGRFEDAEPLLEKGYRMLSTTRGPRDDYTRDAARRLADLYTRTGLAEKAAEYRAIADPD